MEKIKLVNRTNRKDIFERNNLADIVPLSTPYKINIDVANACNFQCKFCFHAVSIDKLKHSGFKPGIMDYDLFTKIILQIKDFPEKIKCIGLAGIGEPLLNKNISRMIAYTKKNKVADKVVITTNGSLLSSELSLSLINAGLDELIISVEALDDQKYYDITKTRVSFRNIVENIIFFHQNKKQCKIFIKIMNISFDKKDDKKKFYDIFGGISDMAYVEQVIPQFKPVDYEQLNINYDKNLYGQGLRNIQVCPMIFYTMQIATSGNVCPCCVDYNESVIFGNIESSSIKDIWSCKKFNQFRKMHLHKKRRLINLCNDCEYLHYNLRKEDSLDGSEQTILNKMEDNESL